MLNKIEESADYLASKMKIRPKIGMITGTGLSSLTERFKVDMRLSFDRIPNFPVSTVKGHKGSLVAGMLSGKAVMALEGRFHLYEGYTAPEITFPIRVMAMLGVKTLLISSAAGGLNPLFHAGDLMIITDHINLTGTNPLIGPNIDQLGPRFPDMSRVYAPETIQLAREIAIKEKVLLREGVYVGLVGPSLETPAETRFLKAIGADAVGMSTVLESIVATHCGMDLLAIVVITNVNLPDCMEETSIEKVIEIAQKSGLILAKLWEHIIAALPS